MLIGTVIVIPVEIISMFFKYMGWTTVTNGEACSMMFMPEGSWTLGILAILSVGAFVISILYYLTKLIGTDYLPNKGYVYLYAGIFFVFTIFGILAKNNPMTQSTSGNYLIAFNSGFGGILAGILMKKYLFSESSKKIKVL